MIGAVNVDAYENAKPDILWDLNKAPWPFNDEEYDRIYAHHVLEHLPEWWNAFKECARILKIGGIAEIAVPDASSDAALAYRDHVQVFAQYSFHGSWTWDGKSCYGGYNAWASKVAGEVPLRMIRYERCPYDQYEWMLRWPFRKLLRFCAVHMRNFIWQQVFTFEKFDRGSLNEK